MRLFSARHGISLLCVVVMTTVPLAAFARTEPFTVKDRYSSGTVFKGSDGRQYYVVTGTCKVYRNDIFHIETPYRGWPVGATEMVRHDGRVDYDCDIVSILEVTHRVTLLRVLGQDGEATLTYKDNDYLIDYSKECKANIWKYQDQKVFLRIQGSLDGIGDELVLPNGDGCTVWDADSIGKTAGKEYLPPCPDNAHENPEDINTCVCDYGYKLNKDYTACVPAEECPFHSTGSWGNCKCEPGWLWLDGQCVTYSASCKDQLGKHALGNINNCYCEAGYQLNATETYCVKKTSLAAKKANDQLYCGKGFEIRSGMCKKTRK